MCVSYNLQLRANIDVVICVLGGKWLISLFISWLVGWLVGQFIGRLVGLAVWVVTFLDKTYKTNSNLVRPNFWALVEVCFVVSAILALVYF